MATPDTDEIVNPADTSRSDQLRTQPPSTPSPAPPPTPTSPLQMPSMEAIRQPLVERQQSLTQQGEELARRKSEETGPLQQAVIEGTKEPAPPPPPKVPLPPVPANEIAPMFTTSPGPNGQPVKPSSVLQNFMGALTEFAGALGGMAAKHPAPMASLAAISGATQGWLEGDAIRRKAEMDRWNMETKRALALHKEQQEEYQDALASHKLSLDQKLRALEVISHKWDDQVTFNLAQQKNVEGLLKELDSREFRYMQLQEMHQRTYEMSQNAQQRIELQKMMMENAAQYHRDLLAFREKELKKSLESQLTPDATTLLAEQMLRTGAMPPMGMKASGDRIAVFNRASEIARSRGIDPSTLPVLRAEFHSQGAALTQLEKQKGTVEAYEKTVEQNIQNALVMSDKRNGQGLTVLNRWIQGGQRATGDPDVAKFHLLVATVSSEYTRVMTANGPGGVTSDTARAESQKLFDPHMTPQQLRAVADGMILDMHSRMKGYDFAIEGLRTGMAGAGMTTENKNRATTVKGVGAPLPE